jgi:hypothetical protein
MPSALPAVMDALIAGAGGALPNIQVEDGFGISGEPGDFLMLGADDPDNEDAAAAFEVQQSRLAMGGARLEEGTIFCVALSWNGDGNQKAARDACFDTVAGVEDYLRANNTLGGLVLKVEFVDLAAQGKQAQGDTGAACWLPFAIAYQAQV